MILGFMAKWPKKTPFAGQETNFVQKILAGEKTLTIRSDPHNRWRAGMKAQMYAPGGPRNGGKQFAEKEIVEVWTWERIDIYNKPEAAAITGISLKNESGYLSLTELESIVFCKKDGFLGSHAFLLWHHAGLMESLTMGIPIKVLCWEKIEGWKS